MRARCRQSILLLGKQSVREGESVESVLPGDPVNGHAPATEVGSGKTGCFPVVCAASLPPGGSIAPCSTLRGPSHAARLGQWLVPAHLLLLMLPGRVLGPCTAIPTSFLMGLQ